LDGVFKGKFRYLVIRIPVIKEEHMIPYSFFTGSYQKIGFEIKKETTKKNQNVEGHLEGLKRIREYGKKEVIKDCVLCEG
jgi:hypothetical protein